MASKIYYFGELTSDVMNGSSSYRVKFSYGVFSVAPKVTQSGTYWYAYKRVARKLHKAYVGKQGNVTADLVHQATMKVKHQYHGYGRDNRGYGPQKLIGG